MAMRIAAAVALVAVTCVLAPRAAAQTPSTQSCAASLVGCASYINTTGTPPDTVAACKGLAIHGGCPELVTKPSKEGAHSYFISPWVSEICKRSLRNLVRVLTVLFIGAIWETVWVLLLTYPSHLLSMAQCRCHLKLSQQVSKEWILITGWLICASLRAFVRVWITGKWVGVVMVTWMEAAKTGERFWNIKFPLRSALYNAGITFLPFLFIKIHQFYTALKRLSRQLSKRHGRHESTRVELSRRRPAAPSQS